MWQRTLACLALVLAPLFWSGNFIAGRLIIGDAGPFTMALIRWLLVIALLTPLVMGSLFQYQRTIKQHLGTLAILGLLCVTCYTSLIYWGLNDTQVVNAALLDATVPIWTVIIAYFAFNEELRPAHILGLVLSLSGASILITHGQLSHLTLHQGDAMILLAAICWALYSLFLRKIANMLPPLLFLYVTACMGTAFLVPVCFIEWFSTSWTALHWNLATLTGLLYAAAFASITAFTFWNIGVFNLGATTASYFFNLIPVFSSLLAIVILNEHFHWHHFLGILLVLAGAYMATANNRRLSIKSFSRHHNH